MTHHPPPRCVWSWTHPLLGLALCALLLPGCGGSGGGGGPVPSGPRLISATFVGAGATPAAGEALLLVFDRDVEVVPSARIDDDDLLLSTGSLGAPSQDPTRPQPFTIRVPLGAGVTFAPGTTRVSVTEACDAIRALGGGRLASSDVAPKVIYIADGDAPVIARITAESLPTPLDGTGPAGGTLQIASSGVDLQVEYSDATQSNPPLAVILTVDGVTVADGVQLEANADISGVLEGGQTSSLAALRVPDTVVLPIGDRVLTAIVIDSSGRPSEPATFAVRPVPANATLRPLELGQIWYVRIDRDIESFEVVPNQLGGSTVSIDSNPNGVADLFDILLIAGLRADQPIADIGDGRDSDAAAWELLRDKILARLATLYDGIDVSFTFEAPGTFPAGRDFVDYRGAGFSEICLAGAPGTTPSGTLGAALVDPRNAGQESNCNPDYFGTRLGVFAHTPINLGLELRDVGFRAAFRAFMPALNGNPIGTVTDDNLRLRGLTGDSREFALGNAIDWLGNILAVVLAHECGHSLGLVANGAMPRGLYGDDPVNFPLSGGQPATNANTHIENRSLFTPPSINVMSAAIDLSAAQQAATQFNPLNKAYLRERALYDDR